MPLPTLALVLVAAGAHAVWNIASKGKRGDTVRFVWVYTAVSAGLCAPLAAASVLLGSTPVAVDLLCAAVVSGILHVTYSLTLQTGYDRADLGVVYPIARGTGPVLTLVCAIVVLGERLRAAEVIGALVIVAGIAIVMGNPFASRRRPLAGAAWGATTGATTAAYTLWDGFSITVLQADPLVYFSATLVVETLLLLPRAMRAPGSMVDTLRRNPVTVPIISVLSPLAYILVLVALQTAPVAVVAPLRESSIVIAALLAWAFFGEDHVGRRLVGAAVVLVGIAAISVG